MGQLWSTTPQCPADPFHPQRREPRRAGLHCLAGGFHHGNRMLQRPRPACCATSTVTGTMSLLKAMSKPSAHWHSAIACSRSITSPIGVTLRIIIEENPSATTLLLPTSNDPETNNGLYRGRCAVCAQRLTQFRSTAPWIPSTCPLLLCCHHCQRLPWLLQVSGTLGWAASQ